jgi:arsenate reductase-like glutaredoxin family protein
LKEEFKKLQAQESQTKINDRLRRKEISWNFNAPLASHTGGMWERMIRSIQRILAALTDEQSIDDEALLTLMAKVEKILNDRPLIRNESQVDDLE